MYFQYWASKGKSNYKPTLIDFQDYDYGDAPISPMYKPYFDVSEMSDWNLAHVNAYIAQIEIGKDGNFLTAIDVKFESPFDTFENTFDKFTDTGYHDKIKEHEFKSDTEAKIETTVELTDDEKSIHRSNSNNLNLDKVVVM